MTITQPKAVISGSHGFIGSALSDYLLRKGWTVVPLSQLVLYTPNELSRFLHEEKPDYIFHLAAYGNMSTQTDNLRILTANILATFNLLEASKDLYYKGFINVGTSSEYGKTDKPMTEETLLQPDTLYAATKASSTHLCRAYAKKYTKPIVTVRPFSVYGPKEASFRFIPTVIQYLQTGLLMDVDMTGMHDWIYIDDLIEGIFTASQHTRELFGQVVNIGTGIHTDNSWIIALLEKIAGKTLNINYFNNMRVNDSPIWVDGSKKLRLYGWKPQISLEEGLKRCYEYYTK